MGPSGFGAPGARAGRAVGGVAEVPVRLRIAMSSSERVTAASCREISRRDFEAGAVAGVVVPAFVFAAGVGAGVGLAAGFSAGGGSTGASTSRAVAEQAAIVRAAVNSAWMARGGRMVRTL
jgi:hypothetical protein